MIKIIVTSQNYNEEAYLASNPDVAEAVKKGDYKSGKAHFDKFGWKENRTIIIENNDSEKTVSDSSNALGYYVLKEPSSQNIIDLFKGEWSSRLPIISGLVAEPGPSNLFEDGRVFWARDVFGDFTNFQILELGPLEAAHTYMFQKFGAKKVVAVESNTRAFFKCLCIKEIFKLDIAEFKLGDFMSFLRNDESKYDIVFASGVLYHMEEPIELLKLISKVSNKTFIWTHYYDDEIISNRDDLKHKFDHISSFEYDGISYDYSTQSYKDALDWTGFCGGPNLVSKWLTRDSIIKALSKFGFVDIYIKFDDPHHPNGPAFGICATK